MIIDNQQILGENCYTSAKEWNTDEHVVLDKHDFYEQEQKCFTSAFIFEVWEVNHLLGEDEEAESSTGVRFVVNASWIGHDFITFVHDNPKSTPRIWWVKMIDTIKSMISGKRWSMLIYLMSPDLGLWISCHL